MSVSELKISDIFLKKILEAPLGQVVTVLGENLNCKISLDLIEQNTPKPGTEFERKIVVSADGLPLIRAIIKFDRNVLPQSILNDLLQKRSLVGTILNRNKIKNKKNVIYLDLDSNGKKILRVYEIRDKDSVLFEVSEEIRLDHLDAIRTKYQI
ncbi:MAG: hypothetical protein K8Q89_01075 [Nitrosarchaeum sp.]|nr:hypothetical protein [Nitrosarchaeum sp.]